MVGDFLDRSQQTSETGKHSSYRQYVENKKQLTNLGIGRMLVDDDDNAELQQYLNEKSYDTASLGETSADELAVQASSDSDAHHIDVFRSEDEVSRSYQEASNLSSAIKDYESDVLSDHLNLDIYRAVGKSKANISFKDLSL